MTWHAWPQNNTRDASPETHAFKARIGELERTHAAYREEAVRQLDYHRNEAALLRAKIAELDQEIARLMVQAPKSKGIGNLIPQGKR